MRLIGSILATAAATVMTLSLGACGREDAPAQRAAAPAGQRLVLQPSDAVGWQDVSAEIATLKEAQVLARIPGILTSLTVREGDVVRQGQVIGRIVDNQLGYQAGAFGAQAAAAQAQVNQAEADYKRVKYLYDRGVYAKARLDQAESSVATARAQVRAAQAQQSAVGAVAGQGTVVAPANGRVLRVDVPAGAPVAPGVVVAVVTAGPTILRLQVPESLAGQIHPGSRVTTAGFGGSSSEGRVMKVYPSIVAGQLTVDVDMAGIDNSLIGRRMAARIETGSRKALLVPLAFVTNRFGIDYVAVLTKDGSAMQVPVQIAPSGQAGSVEVLSGVNPGDTLIGAAAR